MMSMTVVVSLIFGTSFIVEIAFISFCFMVANGLPFWRMVSCLFKNDKLFITALVRLIAVFLIESRNNVTWYVSKGFAIK